MMTNANAVLPTSLALAVSPTRTLHLSIVSLLTLLLLLLLLLLPLRRRLPTTTTI